jgi:hypothetical protein
VDDPLQLEQKYPVFLGRPPIAPALEKRIREAPAAPGRPGVRVIAKRLESILGQCRREKSCLPYLPRGGLIATSHAARENFIRVMPSVAQAIEEVLRSGHVPRANGRLFAI